MCRGWAEVKIFIEHSHLLKWDLSLNPEINRLVQLGSLLHGFCPCHPNAGIRGGPPHPLSFYVRVGDLNSGPYICTESVLSTKLSPKCHK